MHSYQLTIPATNTPGFLANITSILAQEKIDIRAITITSFGDKGFFNLITDEPEHAHKILNKKGIKCELKDILSVLIKDNPGSLDSLVQTLASENINIENAYGYVIESRKYAVFVLEVQDVSAAKAAIRKGGFSIVSPQAVSEIEPFHYMRY